MRVRRAGDDMKADDMKSANRGAIVSPLSGCAAAACIAALFWPSPASSSSCDLVLHWDETTLSDCIKEIKSEAFILQSQVQTLTAENQLLKGHICLLSNELKRLGADSEVTALVSGETCAVLKTKPVTRKPAAPVKVK